MSATATEQTPQELIFGFMVFALVTTIVGTVYEDEALRYLADMKTNVDGIGRLSLDGLEGVFWLMERAFPITFVLGVLGGLQELAESRF